MKMKLNIKLRFTIFFWLISVVFVKGCITVDTSTSITTPTLIISEGNSAYVTPTSEVKPDNTTVVVQKTDLPIRTPEIIPTLTQNEMELLINDLLLTNSGCYYPCIWGFIPGTTPVNSTLQFLNHLGWIVQRFDKPVRFVYWTGEDFDDYSISLAFFSRKTTLDALLFSQTHPNFSGRNIKASITYILEMFGVPDQIWITLNTGGELSLSASDQVGFDTYLFFEKPIFLIKYSGIAVRDKDNFSICLLSEEQQPEGRISYVESYNIVIGSPHLTNTPDGLMSSFGGFYGNLPIETSLNITSENFYNSILVEHETPCFLTPESIWRN